MAKVEITAPELNKLLENILLYTDKKALHLREVLFVGADAGIQAFACDEHVAITDTAETSESIPVAEFALGIEVVEQLLEYVKKDKKVVHKSVLVITFRNTLFKVHCDDYDGYFQADYQKPGWDRWNIVLDLLSDEQDETSAGRFNLNPARLAKLNQLKASKDAPVVFRWVDIQDKLVLQFKKGQSIVGAFQPVDDEYIQEEFLWNNLSESTDQSPSSPSTESAQNNTV